MFVEMRMMKVYQVNPVLKMCYDKRFIINSIKMSLHPEDFTKLTDEELLEEVDLGSENLNLNESLSIDILVNTVIGDGKIKHITEFSAVSVK